MAEPASKLVRRLLSYSDVVHDSEFPELNALLREAAVALSDEEFDAAMAEPASKLTERLRRRAAAKEGGGRLGRVGCDREGAGVMNALEDRSLCPDCGIPKYWCERVTSNPARCWRWDYENFSDTADELRKAKSALEQAEKALRGIDALHVAATDHDDWLAVKAEPWDEAIDRAREALAALGGQDGEETT